MQFTMGKLNTTVFTPYAYALCIRDVDKLLHWY